MKNIEQLIKESLDNHELPYNEAAWESLSKRLDGTTPSPFYRKWWVAASIGTVLVGSSLFFALKSNQAEKPEKHTPAVSQNTTAAGTNNTTENRSETNSSPQTHTISTENQAPNNIQKIVERANNPHIEPAHTPAGAKTEVPAKNQGQPTPPQTPRMTENESGTPNYLPALVGKTKYCVGDDIEIGNPNENTSVAVIQNNKTVLTVKPGGKKIFVAANEGTIELVAGNQRQTISVSKPVSDLYISVDPTLLYEDGIPAIRFSASGSNAPIHWSAEKHASELDNGTFIVHPYKGREITVSAAAKDQNGCPVTETKTITISEDYNLNAPKGIDLNSSDSRASTFMPHALKERNTPFELYIYDAKNGRIIFKTTDASNGWNGTDSNTGEVLQNGTVVLWKVVLGNPNPGEPRDYKGTIVVKTQ